LKDESDPMRYKTHIVGGLSKDFGVPGWKLGFIYSLNEQIRQTLRVQNKYFTVSTTATFLLAQVIQDEEWFHSFLRETHIRLRRRYQLCCETLDKLKIPYVKCSSGYFMWINFAPYMRPFVPTSQTPEAQKKEHLEFLQHEEDRLALSLFQDKHLLFSAGRDLRSPIPGWFRLCFGSVSDQNLIVVLQRLEEFFLIKSNEL